MISISFSPFFKIFKPVPKKQTSITVLQKISQAFLCFGSPQVKWD